MNDSLPLERLRTLGLTADQESQLQSLAPLTDASRRWSRISQAVLAPGDPFPLHQALFAWNYREQDPALGPFWIPDPATCEQANLTSLLNAVSVSDVPALYRWSLEHPGRFWELMTERLSIPLDRPFDAVLDDSRGAEHARWFPGARLNIALSCFPASVPQDKPAIVEHGESTEPRTLSYGQLANQSRRFADGLRQLGIQPGDAIGMVMPMTIEAVVAYLGIILAGGVAVSIADSFSAAEIRRRLDIADAKRVCTVGTQTVSGKRIDNYEKLKSVGRPLLVAPGYPAEPLRDQDVRFDDVQQQGRSDQPPHLAEPDAATNILFSSGTTGDPKAIPWTHTTPLKCAVDGHCYQDIHASDVVAWPTNMGWMMGPWLIYATFINGATMGLFRGHPGTAAFCRFVQDAGVTMLGTVPSLVRAWREQQLLDDVNWAQVTRFSSTGECSHPLDMLYLTSRAGYVPIIEYCGGTEVGGGYLTSTVLQPSCLSSFSTPTLGIGLHLLDAADQPAKRGEAYLQPPSIGFSTRLLNGNHHEAYYENAPRVQEHPLRRHGDHVECREDGYYRVLGRADDTMNLGGIKVSSAEIEQVLLQDAGLQEAAAVAVADSAGGPARLVVFLVLHSAASADAAWRDLLQQRLREQLNPLFKIHAVVLKDRLPRTASNKIMRRILRAEYEG